MIYRALLFCFAILVAGTGVGAAQDRPTLRIATEGAFPPFNFVDDKGEPQGFEVDLAKALCAAMAVECAIVLQDWDGMLAGLKDRRYDAVMSSMTPSPERRARATFSKPYYLVPAAFMARKGDPVPDVSPKALAGRSIGAASHSEHAAYLSDLYGKSDIRLFGKLEDANLDLMAERIELVLGDKLALSRFLATSLGVCCRFAGDAPYSALHHGEGVAAALRRGETDLKARFDRAIDQVIAEGVYDAIRRKHLTIDVRAPAQAR